MMRGGKAFIDTNVLLRGMIARMPLHETANQTIHNLWDTDIELWISRQVVREYLVQVTHPNTLRPPFSLAQVMETVDVIQTFFRIADETQAVTANLFNLIQSYPTGASKSMMPIL